MTQIKNIFVMELQWELIFFGLYDKEIDIDIHILGTFKIQLNGEQIYVQWQFQ